MNSTELRKRLILESVPMEYYSLDEEFPYDAICLHKNGIIWEVYYSDRGNKNEMKIFLIENNACNYFYKYLIKSLKRDGIL